MRVVKERPRARAAAGQQYHMTTAWSFFGSAGLLLLADMAHTTIITATVSIYAPRANLPPRTASLGYAEKKPREAGP